MDSLGNIRKHIYLGPRNSSKLRLFDYCALYKYILLLTYLLTHLVVVVVVVIYEHAIIVVGQYA